MQLGHLMLTLGHLALKLTVATWEVTTEFFSLLSFELELRLKMKASAACCFENDLGDSEL